VSVSASVVNLLEVDGLVAGIAVGHGRNGSADAGQGGPVRVRGGSSAGRTQAGTVLAVLRGFLGHNRAL
jgi:hypothetical protein